MRVYDAEAQRQREMRKTREYGTENRGKYTREVRTETERKKEEERRRDREKR